MSDDPLAAIREVDSAGQLDDVLGLPDQLGDALWRVESAGIAGLEANGLAVCGMGGSGIGGALARAALGDSLSRPLRVVRDYELAPWASPDNLILCMSYSGNTEETLACFEGAEALGAQRVVATTGGALAEGARAAGVPVIGIPSGLQPRAAVGYMFAIVAETAAVIEASAPIRTDIDAAAAWLTEQRDSLVARSAEIAGRARRDRPHRLRLRPHRAGRLPVEDADQRERETARVHALLAGARPQRDRRLGAAHQRRPVLGGLPGGLRSAPALAPARRADRQADRARRQRRFCGLKPTGPTAPRGCCGR